MTQNTSSASIVSATKIPTQEEMEEMIKGVKRKHPRSKTHTLKVKKNELIEILTVADQVEEIRKQRSSIYTELKNIGLTLRDIQLLKNKSVDRGYIKREINKNDLEIDRLKSSILTVQKIEKYI